MKLKIDMKFDPKVGTLLWTGVAVQFLLWFLDGLIASGEESFYFIVYGSVAFWSTAVLVVLRRPCKLTRWDVYFLRYGLVFITLTSCTLVPLIWQWRIGS
ncbi:hypothetical protein [Prosthecobacter sp.]|uniref:hypothetical protein n=1 Tax=Prosthecobacter sp. TaxID=1965333 RepID=UPI00248702C6|nr:hypothetical protein [Prosthecobacter sp.]MDI1312705.1 hypothetical protein [Prosthecobacter sp.]